MATRRLAVECLECGRRFMTARMLPECPRCGGGDIDLATPGVTAGDKGEADLWAAATRRAELNARLEASGW